MSTDIIKQQYLHVEMTGTEADGSSLQQRLPRIYQERIAPAIERVLNRYSPADQHIILDRLEISIGSLALDRVEPDAADAVAKALEESLRKLLDAEQDPAATGSAALRRTTNGESVHHAFMHFLMHGTLPWSFRLRAGSTLEQTVLATWRSPDQAAISLQRIGGELLDLLKSETARKRLIRQFSLEFQKSILFLISPSGEESFTEIMSSVQCVPQPPESWRILETRLVETMLASIVMGRPLTVTALSAQLKHALEKTFIDRGARAEVMARLRAGTAFEESAAADNKEAPLPAPQSTDRQLSREAATFGYPEESTGLPGSIPETPDSPGYSNSPEHEAEQRQTFTLEIGEGIYIRNAGLVLLHPFLPLFFEKLAIASEGKLVQPERALSLLHFLATGQVDAPEYELFLPKVLCAIDPEIPVTADVGLTVTEQEEASALLSAVIHHWRALGNSSPDALRGTFLLRNGKVSMRDGDWLLQVESHAFDILLDQLPWSISLVKLPWMDRMLWVEW